MLTYSNNGHIGDLVLEALRLIAHVLRHLVPGVPDWREERN